VSNMPYLEIEDIVKTDKPNEIHVYAKIYFKNFLEKITKTPTASLVFYIEKTESGALRLFRTVGLQNFGGIKKDENKYLSEETAAAIRKKYKELYGEDL